MTPVGLTLAEGAGASPGPVELTREERAKLLARHEGYWLGGAGAHLAYWRDRALRAEGELLAIRLREAGEEERLP